MEKSLVVLCSLFALFSAAYAGNIFNNIYGPPIDQDIAIREIRDPQCQWFNSGFLAWRNDRVNATTTCRCRAVNLKECRTVHNLESPTTTTAKPAASDSAVNHHNSNNNDSHSTTTTTTTTTKTTTSAPIAAVSTAATK